jgi:hypothetical protein
VAAIFTAVTAFCSAVFVTRALGGASPKSAKTSAELPKVPRTTVWNARMSASCDGDWTRSISIFAFVAALDASTASRLSTKPCSSCVNAVTVKIAPPARSAWLPFGKCLLAPAINCVTSAARLFFALMFDMVVPFPFP